MSEKTNSVVDFENPVKTEDKKETIKIFGKEIKKSTVFKTVGTLTAVGIGVAAVRQIEKSYTSGWKAGYNTGCVVTTILERTPKSRLREVGNKIGVNAEKHMELSDKVWSEQGPKLLGRKNW